MINSQKEYKIIRSHKFSKQRLKSILKRPPTTFKHQLLNEIISTAIIMNTEHKEFQININNNEMLLYDPSTYVQTTFNNIYFSQQSRQVWHSIKTQLVKNRNFLLLYMQTTENQQIFINNEIIKKSILENPKLQQIEQYSGILEKSIKLLAQSINKQQGEELLLSAIGLDGDHMIDLLNFDYEQNFDLKLKITKEGRFITVQNITQIGIQNVQSFINTFTVCEHIKNYYTEISSKQLQAEIFQICIGKLNNQKNLIESIKYKYNFVKVYKQQSNLKTSIGSCLRNIQNQQIQFIPTRNSKLTHLLEDCLNKQSKIYVMYEIDKCQFLRSQIQNLIFNEYLNRRVFIKKNYLGNKKIIDKIKKQKNTLIMNLEDIQTEEIKLSNIKKLKLGQKYNVKNNRALFTETVCSVNRRRLIYDSNKSSSRPISKLDYFMISNKSMIQKVQIAKNVYKIEK